MGERVLCKEDALTGADNYELTWIEDYAARRARTHGGYDTIWGRNDAVVILFRKLGAGCACRGATDQRGRTLSRADFAGK
jgi:hypothetical protein